MPRTIAALLVGLSLAALTGCPPNMPPEPPDPPRPILVVHDDSVDLAADRGDQETRQRALRVMAIEQRTLLNALENERRFVRVSSNMSGNFRDALVEAHHDLVSVERGIAQLEGEDSMSPADRLDRQDELKGRLRRVASRLGLLENAIRGR